MNVAEYSIVVASAADVRALAEHWQREVIDNGRDGLWFSPYDPDEDAKPITDERIAQISAAIERPVTEPMWQRVWTLRHRDAPERVLGSLSLHGGRIVSELHRCSLGMGIEPEHRGRRNGTALVEQAIAWARATGQLSWIDLGVFAGNHRAKALYTRAGFAVVGERRDAFRVRGVKITDVTMTLCLDEARGATT